MDIGTGLALFGSKELMTRLLGPTVDYIGEGGKQVAKQCCANLGNIFSIALRRVGDRIDTDGTVSPRVLQAILDEGAFCEDAVAAEYLGGVLASARTEGGRDDRGVMGSRAGRDYGGLLRRILARCLRRRPFQRSNRHRPDRSGKTALQGPLNELVVRWRFTTAQQDLVETERRVPLLGCCPIRIDLASKTTGCPSLCSCVQCVGEAGAVTTYRKGPSHPPGTMLWERLQSAFPPCPRAS